MVLALALPAAIATLLIAALFLRLRVGRRLSRAMLLEAPSPMPVSQDSSLVAQGTGGISAPVAGAHEPLGDELCALGADHHLPTGRPFGAQLLWTQRYAGHVLVDLYVVNGAPADPAASLLCVLPASPWASWQIHWLLHHWAAASRVAQVEMTAGTARPLLRISCDRFELVLAVDHWPAVHC
jgi:hypothetical protein